MSNFKLLKTTPQVWHAIQNAHFNDLRCYGSFSNPTGREFGGSGTHGEMMTIYSLPGSHTPLIQISTTWDIDESKPNERINEKHEHWLCLPQQED